MGCRGGRWLIKRIKEGKGHVGVYGSLMNGLKGVGMVDLEVKRRKGGGMDLEDLRE